MSQILIQQYLNQLSTLRKVSGSHRESVVREAFKDLLKNLGRTHDLHFIPEYEIESKTKERRYVDGALLYELRMPFGYWEAKDENDDLNAEIALKFKRGYPQDNIIFEDTREAVLIQNRHEVVRCRVDDVKNLNKLLTLFFAYERKGVAEFRRAVEQFKTDLPAVLEALRAMIEKAHVENTEFRRASSWFLKHAQETINPSVTNADVREMLIQHVLTEDIFSKVFDEDDFHRQNNVAKELYALEGTFFTGDLKKRTLRGLDAYYTAIRSAATQISSHTEKQTFLKVIYENFYKVYNAKAADRLGVVYTPNEIVRFMIESADWLCETHFGRTLIDKDVDILDPATGTGTFISELLEHFRGQPAKLKFKYVNELHSNELAILPYYVANLNIEATFAAITGEYLEYPNLCFVDTLDNVAALRKYSGHMDDLFGSVSEENVGRIRRQNSRRISVVIGNPPYNANQLNENENNKNREYPTIDARIKETYIKASTAQKTKLYDMYARFFRWASDRLDRNGILAFITNRSFIESRTFDGFRKCVGNEFNEIRIIDLGGDVRANPKLSGKKHNVFGIQTGVAISFFIRRDKQKGTRILYLRRPEMETSESKLQFLSSTRMEHLEFDEIKPDEKYNWLNLTDNDFQALVPTGTKIGKGKLATVEPKAIFGLFSQGIKTNRDEWVCEFSRESVLRRTKFLIESYNRQLAMLRGTITKESVAAQLTYDIKWTRKLKNLLIAGRELKFDERLAVQTIYRPFTKLYTYFAWELNEDWYQLASIFKEEPNPTITFLCVFSSNPLAAMAVRQPFDYCLLKRGNGGTECLPYWRYEKDGRRVENVTDWALEKFRKRYTAGRRKSSQALTKEAIFHYVYAVLHNPVYAEKYAVNLKREFPRIPLYEDFWLWSGWGRRLMELHLDFELVPGANLKRVDTVDEKARSAGLSPRAILRAQPERGCIVIDSETLLEDIPAEAWAYKPGSRSALEWVLDQYKESRPKDPVIREKFDDYHFFEHKEKVVDLLMRITTVSIETMKIVNAMKDNADESS